MKTDVNVLSKSNKHNKLQKTHFLLASYHIQPLDEKRRIQIRIRKIVVRMRGSESVPKSESTQIQNTLESLKLLENNAIVSQTAATRRVRYLLGFFSELGSMGCPFSSSFILGLGPRFFGSGFGSGSFFSLQEIDPVTILQDQSQRYRYHTW